MQRDSRQTVSLFFLSVNSIFIVSYKNNNKGGNIYDIIQITNHFRAN